jgi:hypothetical protein
MEANMKKAVFIITLLFSICILSNTLFAGSEDDYKTALQYFNSGKYEESIPYFKSYVEKKPDPKAYYSLGYALYEVGRHDEAMEYFQDAYLIDPEISPVPSSYYETYKEEKARRGLEQPAPEAESEKPEAKKEPVSEKKPAVTAEPQQPAAPVAAVEKKAPPPPSAKPAEKAAPAPAPEKTAPKPAPRKITPPKKAPPAGFEKFLQPDQKIPGIPSDIVAMILAFGIVLQIVVLAIYLFAALCHFLIGRKLAVTASWLAFVPLVGAFWPLVGAARKPWWWILILFFVPIVNLILFIYCYMLIAENLGKSKWLGLLILIPVVNLIFLAILAFSKSPASTDETYYADEPLDEEAQKMFED